MQGWVVSFMVAAPVLAATYSVNPKTVALGGTYTVTVTQADCKEPGNLAQAWLSTPTAGLGISPAGVGGALSCQAAFKLEVQSGAPLGPTDLVLKDKEKDGAVLALLRVEVTAAAPGPIPPGLDPQVDVMWKILPWRQVADSFGRKVANQYFAVQITVGNNSGWPIQFTSIGFLTAAMKSSKVPPLPNDPYNIPRGTIEREQQTGRRAVVRHSLDGVLGVLAPISGFFRNSRPKANYSLLVALGSPAGTALDLIWPDKTVRHLIALDTRTFRDAAIVPNNVPSPPILAFVGRDLVECGKADCGAAVRGFQRIPGNRTEFDPNRIMDALGELVLTGQPIQYLPRISIAGNTVTSTPAPPVANPVGADGTMNQGESQHAVTITGNALKNASVAADAGAGVSVRGLPEIDANGRSMRVLLDVADEATPGETGLTISTAAGTYRVPIRITAAKPAFTLAPVAAAQSDLRPFILTAKGKFLKGAVFQMVDPAGNKNLEAKVGDAADEVKVTLNLPGTAAPQKVQIVAVRNGQTSAPAAFELTASAPVLEAGAPALSGVKGAADSGRKDDSRQIPPGREDHHPGSGLGPGDFGHRVEGTGGRGVA